MSKGKEIPDLIADLYVVLIYLIVELVSSAVATITGITDASENPFYRQLFTRSSAC